MARRVAAVTGSNKGIGFAIVRALCKQFDGDVYLTARDETRGMEAVKKLGKEGLKPKFHLLDITDRKSVDTFKDYLVKNYGGVDVFVHNAAIAFKGKDPTPFAKQAIDTIDVNYTCAVYVCNTVLPVMKENGRICIVASFVGKMSLAKCSVENQAIFKSPDLSEEELTKKLNQFVEAAQKGDHEKLGFANTTYGMSKLGMLAYTRILAKRAAGLKQRNVLVNCACPGHVKTDMSSHTGQKTPDEGAITPTFLAMIPASETKPNGEYLSEKKVEEWYK